MLLSYHLSLLTQFLAYRGSIQLPSSKILPHVITDSPIIRQCFFKIDQSYENRRQDTKHNLFHILDVQLDFNTHIDTNLYLTSDFNYLFCYQIYIYNHMKCVLLSFFYLFMLVIILKTSKFLSPVLILLEKSSRVLQLSLHLSKLCINA